MTCRCGVCRLCRNRLAQAKYKKTAKGKATNRRYVHSATRRASQKRYRATAQAKQRNAVHNSRRIFVGRAYRGRVETVAQADAIQAHVSKRLREFRRQQALDRRA